MAGAIAPAVAGALAGAQQTGVDMTCTVWAAGQSTGHDSQSRADAADALDELLKV